MTTTSVMRYDAARAALAEARSFDEVKDIHDKAEAMRQYGRMAKDMQMEIDAAEIRLRAERRLGHMLDVLKRTGDLGAGRRRKNNGSGREPLSSPATLAEMGIDKKLSMRAQRVAGVPEDEFESRVADLRDRMQEKGSRVSLDIVRDADKAAQRAAHQTRIDGGGTVVDLVGLAESGYRAGVILADPPWHFLTRSARGEGRSANQHYTTDPVDEIKALPVKDLAADDCVLFMWMVDWAPQAALDVIAAWGFEHKTSAFTWVKTNQAGYFMGQGYWTRANPETCWLATKGHPKRLNADVRQLVLARLDEHSKKPIDIYQRIERLVSGPYLELYARKPRDGWTSWGNELPAPTFETPETPHDPETGEIIEEPRATPFDDGEPDEIVAAPISVRAPITSDDFDAERDMPEFLKRTPERTN